MESAPQQSFARPIRSREGTETATLTTFRINTCKSVSKQSTLTLFRMNTYEKQGEGGTPADRRLTLSGVPISSAHHMRHVTPLSTVPSLDCAYFLSPRGCAPYALQISASDPVADGDRIPATPFFHFARRLEIESPQPPSWESPVGDERRRTPRYPFIATAEVLDQSSQATIATRVTELSLNGCYLDMPNPLPKDAQIKIKIYTESKFFESAGTIVYSQANLGVGVSFRETRPQFVTVLKQWLLAAAVAKYGTKK